MSPAPSVLNCQFINSSPTAVITMPSSDYTASSGALKLKGAAGIVKKKKRRPKPAETGAESSSSNSKKDNPEEVSQSLVSKQNPDDENEVKEELVRLKAAGGAKTEAELRFEEKRRKRLEEQLRKDGSKTHKERVEDLNRYLSKLSEHHDM